MKSSVCR